MKIFKTLLKLFLIYWVASGSAVFGQEQRPAKVRVVAVQEKEVAENSRFVGILYYERVSHISSEVAGMLNAVHIREGMTVGKGDMLVTINDDFFQKDKTLEQARIDQASVRIRKAKKNLERYRKLMKSDAASEIDYDNIFFSHQELIKEILALKTSLEKIHLQIEKCVISAPFNGIILKKQADVGDWVIPGVALCEIGSTDDLLAKVAVSEKLVRFALPGESVDVMIDAYGIALKGTIQGILPVADPKTKNLFLKVRMENIRGLEVPVAENMSVTVSVPTSGKKKMKMVPRDALIKFQGKDFVYTVKEGKAAILPVTIVSYMGAEAGVIDAHITAGMQVVVDGNERLQPDQPVIVQGEKNESD